MYPLTRLSALLTVSLALTLGSAAALAHGDTTPDTMKSAHGGQARMAGTYYFELVVEKNTQEAKDKPVQVYVTDHAGTKLSTAGATGTVTLLSRKSKATATLLPDGDNRLKGVANYASTPDLKAVLSITMPGKQPEQARFTPMSASKDGHTDHTH